MIFEGMDAIERRRLDNLFESHMTVAEGADVFLCDMKHDVSRWSKRAVELYNLPSEYMKAAGNIWEEHIHPDDRDAYHQSIAEIMEGRSGGHDMQYRARDEQGHYYMCTCRGSVIRSVDDSPRYFVGVIRNHSMRGRIDSLTGLRNQDGFRADMESYLKNKIPVRILLIGTSNFSRHNELYGYDFGNTILQRCARYALDHSSNWGSLYRMDGIKLALVSKDKSMQQLQSWYEEIRKICVNAFEIEDKLVDLPVNGGAIEIENFDINVDTVLACLNSVYSQSKNQQGGDLCIFENGLTGENRQRLELLNEIRSSVMENCKGFQMYYQPIINAKDDSLRGAESLIRWNNSEGKTVPPGMFIDVLERDAIYPTLGEWILTSSITAAKDMLKQYPDFLLHVNLSYSQLQKEDFVPMVIEALKTTGYPAKNLCLEITERCRMIDLQRLRDVITQLEQEGVTFALDDFGTGFSSMDVIQELPCSILKIDRAFIRDIEEDTNEQRLVSVVQKLAQIYHMECCVEGIETEKARDILRSCDVDTLQGYLYSKPVPFEEFKDKYLS